jgi:hypothetical protein
MKRARDHARVTGHPEAEQGHKGEGGRQQRDRPHSCLWHSPHPRPTDLRTPHPLHAPRPLSRGMAMNRKNSAISTVIPTNVVIMVSRGSSQRRQHTSGRVNGR